MGGPAQLGPSSHSVMNKLKDSDMVFEDDGGNDDDIVGDSDSR